MNFPLAWDKARGHAYVGLLEPGYPGQYSTSSLAVTPHPDLAANYRNHFMPGFVQQVYPNVVSAIENLNDHATHVAGIITAQSNNGSALNTNSPTGGVVGGCANCSLATFPVINNSETAPFFALNAPASTFLTAYVAAITSATDSGMQIINWSGELIGAPFSCADYVNPMCAALAYAKERNVLIVEAAGNQRRIESNLPSPVNLASQFSILVVGGTEIFAPTPSTPGSAWSYSASIGTNYATLDGVVAPAKSIISTMTKFKDYQYEAHAKCGDGYGTDESGGRYLYGHGDGFGSCTGTSMAAPHVSALAGLVRSVNPRLSYLQVNNIIRQSGNLANLRTAELGYGLPNAVNAVNAAIATNVNKLTPLYSLYSNGRSDSFYTTVPHMANAALDGGLKPRNWLGNGYSNSSHGVYSSAYGASLGTYWTFPRNPFVIGGTGNQSPLAQVWVFTTHENPKNASILLEPLVRMSWKCGDITPYYPAICSTKPQHIETVLINQSETAYFQWLGYKIDGTEAYVYPKSLPQPAGTVRLMRKYNESRDDFAVFPETALSTMQGQGYLHDGNYSEWLGYVYPNTSGQTPAIQ